MTPSLSFQLIKKTSFKFKKRIRVGANMLASEIDSKVALITSLIINFDLFDKFG